MSGKKQFTGRKASDASTRSMLAPSVNKSVKKSVRKKETEEERLEREGNLVHSVYRFTFL